MIHLTRLNHVPVVLNADLIEMIEVTPDTVIRLTTGEKLVVLEPAEEVVRLVLEFRRAIQGGARPCPGICDHPPEEPDAGNRSGWRPVETHER
ncbi:MAG TPA: flagellar FlbD family protein [Bryobacteraceae bacterium]|nr:flagellar FlbD family protein [Bryobacteraceae bacterium]